MSYTRKVDTRRSYKSVMKTIVDAINGAGGKSVKSRSERLKRRFFGTYAESMFTYIHEGYMLKSRGLSDELGEQWPPLAPSTIAARPVTRADIQKFHIHPQKTRGLLSPKENTIWKKIFKRKFDEYFQGNMAHDEAKAKAAKAAWYWLKRMGAKTRKGLLGGRNVLILVDSGRLERSLRPGKMQVFSYRPYNKDQIYEIRGKQMMMGTRVPYAKYHQTGTKYHPPRPPIPSAKAMRKWSLRAARQASETIADSLAEVIT